MKNTKLNKRKNVFVMFAFMLMFALTMTTVVSAGITPAYADEGDESSETPDTALEGLYEDLNNNNNNSGGGGDYSLDKLETTAKNTISDVEKTVVEICMALFPLSLILGLVVLFFTHDERKISLTVKICITICIVTALILLIHAGTVEGIIRSFTEKLQ